MRILQVAPLIAPIDERRQIGGAQVLIAELARGLARAGHTVALAGADGSFVDGVRALDLGIDSRALIPAPLGVHTGGRADDDAERAAFARVRAWLDGHASEIDLVHAHAYDAAAFDVLARAPRPVLHTLHLPPNDANVVASAARTHDAVLVTVSEANARAWREAGVRVSAVVPNGVDIGAIPVGTRRGPHLLYAGRLSPEKGVETALTIAERTGRGLLLVGPVYDAAYHARAIAPRVRAVEELDEMPVRGAVYVGARPRKVVHRLMGSAAVTLMPVRWDEPFGLVAVESLATGTPVVASRRGGLVEIVDERVGALLDPDDIDGFARAADRLAERGDPVMCRRRAERFDLGTMVSRYLALYEGARDG